MLMCGRSFICQSQYRTHLSSFGSTVTQDSVHKASRGSTRDHNLSNLRRVKCKHTWHLEQDISQCKGWHTSVFIILTFYWRIHGLVYILARVAAIIDTWSSLIFLQLRQTGCALGAEVWGLDTSLRTCVFILMYLWKQKGSVNACKFMMTVMTCFCAHINTKDL